MSFSQIYRTSHRTWASYSKSSKTIKVTVKLSTRRNWEIIALEGGYGLVLTWSTQVTSWHGTQSQPIQARQPCAGGNPSRRNIKAMAIWSLWSRVVSTKCPLPSSLMRPCHRCVQVTCEPRRSVWPPLVSRNFLWSRRPTPLSIQRLRLKRWRTRRATSIRSQ